MPTSEQAQQLFGAVSGLGDSVDSLQRSVDDLASKSDIQESEIKRGKRRDKWLAVSVALDVILTVALLFLGNGVLGNQGRIDQVQHAQQTDTSRNATAVCAFLGIFFQLEPNLAKSPNYSPEQKANQVAFFGTLHNIAKDLGCKQ